MMVVMDLGLAGKTALVTAASGGLGYATALALAGEGAHVAICSRELGRAQEAAATIAADTGATVHGFAADVSVAADLERLVGDAADALGGLDVLVNNAGGPPPGGFDTLDDAAWERGFQLTLMSAVRGIRNALPHFERAGGGSILTILSSSIKQPIPNLLISNVYRPGLAGLTKSLAIDLAPQGIRVNGLAPGRIATDRTLQLNAALAERQGKTPDEIMKASVATIPMGRLGEADEFGRVAAFLCSPAASYVTGHMMIVDGGSVRAL
jgi:3-oxoacyl-[acyl-carrier protein] reductase